MAASPDVPASETKSPTQTSPSRQDPADSKQSLAAKTEPGLTAEASKPLAPPPRPAQAGNNSPGDYFSSQAPGSLNLEPNPFEQSFGGTTGPETPGGTKLPSVAALTSPSSLLPGTNGTPFNWPGDSLRTGPLSPAMLSGPATDYFSNAHIRGFPTPNESSLRTGLTPGGSGSMFPAPSPNSALLAQMTSSGATPGTLEFHRTALSAAAKRDANGTVIATTSATGPSQQAIAASSAPDAPAAPVAVSEKPEPKTDVKPSAGPFDPHDNDAANGLFMLAQGRNGAQNGVTSFPPASHPPQGHSVVAPPQAINASPQMGSVNGASVGSGSARAGSEEGSAVSDESMEPPKPAPRGKGGRKTNGTTTNGRRKAADDGTSGKGANKKSKANSGAAVIVNGHSSDHSDEDDDERKHQNDDVQTKSKMTEEEKRKNFLERNRVAALKCRQRKKQWLQNLQTKVEMYSAENEGLTTQIAQLREEVVNLKTLLLAHKDCPVTQQQTQAAMAQGGVGPILQVVEPFPHQMNPYNMAASMPNGPVMAGANVQRRFS